MRRRWAIRVWMMLAAVSTAVSAPDAFSERLLAAGQLYRQGEYAGAERILLEALKEAATFAPGDPRTAIVLNNLGSVYHFTNRYPQAEQCYRRAVEIEAVAWETVDDRPFRSVLNLAGLYIETGQYAKAERLGLRSLAERQPLRKTADFARLLALLGDLEQHRGRIGSAQEFNEKALAIFQELAPDGRAVMETLNNLCVLYRESGQNPDALARCERALRIAEGMPNLEPSMQALLLANVGTLQFLVHGPAEAEPFFAKALATAESGLGREHPLVGRILFSYADLLERTNRKAEANKCRRRAKAILEAASATDSTKYTVDLGDLLRRQSSH